MSRTLILASAAAVLIALTGTPAQSGAFNRAAGEWWHAVWPAVKPAVKPAAKFTRDEFIELTKAEIKRARREEAARERAWGSKGEQ
jgi:hypothetical protein